MTAVVTSEPRMYGPGSEASYFQDIALASWSSAPGHSAAIANLTRYAQELDVEMASRSVEGLRAQKKAREIRRAGKDIETRVGANSTTIAGFTTPQWLTQYWAAYRSPDRSFTDQTMKLDLPDFGLQVNVPSFASATSFGTQTELSGTSQTDPTGTDIATNLVTQAGSVNISQQLFDRGGMSGMSFDKILITQMISQLEASVDSYVIGQALANAGTVTDATWSYANFLSDVAKAREQLSDTSGVRLLATHIFSSSDFFGYATRQVDSQNRPILVPDSGAIMMAAQMNDPMWSSWTGVHLGQLRWHTDDNIPALGSNTQIIVARPETVVTFDGEETSFAYPETSAQSLSVVVGLRAYVAAVVRFPKAIASISGAAYPTSNV